MNVVMLPLQSAMKWSVAGGRSAWGAAAVFVSLASFDYQRLTVEYLWHHAHSWKLLSGCEWDGSDSGTHHFLPVWGPAYGMLAFKPYSETGFCSLFRLV